MLYDTLVTILDKLREEAPQAHSNRYLPPETDVEKLNYARSRAYVHLYFKVLFGLLDFSERERCITDGPYDGGIDGYHIEEGTKTIYLVQSKFRTNETNFETKRISLEEVLKMDVNRILEGEACDEEGNPYNGKIRQLQRDVSGLPDIARYSYRITLLANLQDITSAKLRQLTGGYPVEVIDFDRSYTSLVFPVIAGTYFTASDISIPIDLSNKNAGSKISYTVKTKISDCEITVLFAPTLEIAKIMSKYKNSVLKYNPRSYLDLEGQSVNQSIRATILTTDTNEFALYNNGITILSDETNINEKIGQKNKAQLHLRNPQIINGGQTSYTLSRLYDEKHNDNPEGLFENKEVLLKIITLIGDPSHENKLRLIEEISNATNKQTPVINADRFANDILHQQIQAKVYHRYGLLYERKRGEFSDGLKNGYVSPASVIERNLFLRIFYAANGEIDRGFQKRLFQRNDFADFNLHNDLAFDRWFLGFCVFSQLMKGRPAMSSVAKDIYAKVYAYIQLFIAQGLIADGAVIATNLHILNERWDVFLADRPPSAFTYLDAEAGQEKTNDIRYYRSSAFERDVVKFFGVRVPQCN